MELERLCGQTREELLLRFSPRNQPCYCRSIAEIHDAQYPTLSELNRAYGEQSAAQWLIPHLIDLSIFTGVKDRFTDANIISLAEVIQTEYCFLTITELMSFFMRFKAGKYSEFYGAVDPLLITRSLMRYCKEREQELFYVERQKEQKRQKKQRELSGKESVTYDEYLEQLQSFCDFCGLLIKCLAVYWA